MNTNAPEMPLTRECRPTKKKKNQIQKKPGMGVDEGYMIVYNEMNRIFAMKKKKKNLKK